VARKVSNLPKESDGFLIDIVESNLTGSP